MTAELFIEERFLLALKELFKTLCPAAIIWAYGSRVDGSAHAGSDLDLAIVEFGDAAVGYSELKEAITESHIPFLIDIFELNMLPTSFQQEIERNYVVLYDGRKDQ